MKIEYLSGKNVVQLTNARKTRKFPAIASIEAYWHGVRNGRLMPARSEVDPRGFADSLSCAFILERIAPGLARIRLSGQHLVDILGMEVRGMPLSAFFLPAARAEIHDALEQAFDTPAIVTLSLKGDAGMFKTARDAQMVLMPLRDETGAVTRVLGALQVDGKLGRAPTRFSIRSLETDPLLTDTGLNFQTQPRAKTPEAEIKEARAQRVYAAQDVVRTRPVPPVTRVDLSRGAKTKAPQAGFGEDAQPFATKPSGSAKKPPKLHLIKSE